MGFPILDVVNVIGQIIDKAIPDPNARMQLQLELAKLADAESAREHDEIQGQISTNTEEAKSSSLFVAGWRPAIGWVCATGFAYSFVFSPIAQFAARLFHYTGDFPVLPTDAMMTLGMGMLGMGYMRMKEKMAGVPDSTIGTPSAPAISAAPAPKRKILGIPWPF